MHEIENRTVRTSSDDLQRLKQLACRVKRTRGIQHHEVLEVVARRIRFDNWHQVVGANKALRSAELAIGEGVVIAMEVKEA